ncbi:MAG: aminotransferase class I/II-fold pyridoxal phosphate-dependent enzyme, partial [Lentisphaerae bacterium]|nr:aminotransferase class I/II-fold pyridoxal phosphate-dependent enzyme [Lentisphaerota bacterium]
MIVWKITLIKRVSDNETINKSALEFLFIVDEGGKLVGVVTDGDIRRSFIKGATVNDSIRTVMKSNFTSLPYNSPDHLIKQKLRPPIFFIPLLDSTGRAVDYATLTHQHSFPVAEPVFAGNELEYLEECIKTGWVSSQGRFINLFEKHLSDFHNAENVLAVSNGTTALHLALTALGIGPGDEVIVPTLTFAASVNAIIYTGATPVFIDICPESWNIDADGIEKLITDKTRAVMPVHLYGNPCRMDRIMEISKKYGLLVIEDCAEALGASWDGDIVGTFGDASCFSFFGNKIITTGEGGAVIFKDPNVKEKAGILRDHGMDKKRKYWHNEVGFNYRMTNIQAAIGVAQMERLGQILRQKDSISASYDENLRPLNLLKRPSCKDHRAKSVCWLYTASIDETLGLSRNELLDRLLLCGVEARPVFFPLHHMPPYQKYVRDMHFPVSEKIS